MFNLVVRYVGFLKYVPGVPHIFDAMLKIGLFFTNRKLLNYIDHVEETVSAWRNVSVTIHKYGGTQFNLNGFEIAHLHGNGLLDVLLNREIKAEFINQPSVSDHHIFKNSGWISLWIKNPSDCTLALSILERAYAFRSHRMH